MRALKLLLALLICAVPATADSVYDVSGALTIVGNNACGGPPCVETLAFSFQVDYQTVLSGFSVNYFGHVLPGATIASFGPTAPFTQVSFGSGNFIAFFNYFGGDEIDIYALNPTTSLPPTFGYAGSLASLYTCGTDPVCVTDFGSGFGGIAAGPLTYTVTAIPEGSILSYLLLGVGLGLLGTFARGAFVHRHRISDLSQEISTGDEGAAIDPPLPQASVVGVHVGVGWLRAILCAPFPASPRSRASDRAA
jgi:hypothetical protein